MSACPFCEIREGHKETSVIYEDADFLAFLDHRPLFLGHTLVIPKTHYVTFYDLPHEKLGAFFALVQKVGKAIEKATNSEGTFLAMNNKVSQSVPHLHVHVVPRNKGDGLKGFFWPRQKFSEEDFHLIQSKIKSLLS